MNFALALVISLISVGCGLTPPKVTPCSIINGQVAQCNPASTDEEPYDKEIRKMRGYRCMSPEDVAKTKAYMHKLVEELANN